MIEWNKAVVLLIFCLVLVGVALVIGNTNPLDYLDTPGQYYDRLPLYP